ncbi:protein adenylyltransferase SelO [Neisseria montereyensis]|uniref:Protein nucleotidyltransferase YdiU n=1 Tax=Neisseria montereyensis TaxID=2973938 RepID=A0ABT2F9I0_9NEIS|nr:YdiU family protein [Neisseria montereyensis]MCS4532839.1 YdiU family protein [Neisseria montereyensis]
MSHTLPLQLQSLMVLPESFYSRVRPEPLGEPYWVAQNHTLAAEMGLRPSEIFDNPDNLLYLSGSAKQYDPAPIATVYSGHQFGVYVRQLGDGRAMLIGDSVAADGKRWEWQLKGAGKTPYSRFADGRAVLRSSIREYLCSEAMHGLGIPTTRALALTGSNDAVYREQAETAAVVTRIAPSFIRFGHFEYMYHTGQHQNLPLLADYLIDQHFPACRDAENPYLALFHEVNRRTAELVAAWQSVGFCHGVLNTDNMSALGLTIDYGPFGFLDAYDRHHICNHSDTGGRYAYNEQPYVVHWNLMRFASCLLPMVSESELVAELERFPEMFQTAYLSRMRAKLGLQTIDKDDEELVGDMFASLQGRKVDFTLFFRYLSEVSNQHGEPLPERLTTLFDGPMEAFTAWIGCYRGRLRAENSDPAARAERMNAVNPLYVLRNYLLEQAIELAKNGDFREIERLHRCMQNPFVEQQEFADFAVLPPEWAGGICVSCSS